MNVYWTDGAVGDLRAVHDYVSQFSREYADALTKRITRRSRQISQFPLSGTKIIAFGLGQIREIYEDKYRIIYYLTPDEIQILAVLHSARNLLREP